LMVLTTLDSGAVRLCGYWLKVCLFSEWLWTNRAVVIFKQPRHPSLGRKH